MEIIDKKKLAEEIKKKALLKGHFVLRSGKVSDTYFDKYQFESRPDLLEAIAFYMQTFIPKDTEILAGLEMGGIPLATALSLKGGLPSVFVRKKAKNYGTKKIAEGPSVKGKKICLIEDVVTTGGQLMLSAQELKAKGALIASALCVIYRGDAAILKNIQAETGPLKYLFTAKDFI